MEGTSLYYCVASVRLDSGAPITGILTRPSQLGSARWVVGEGGAGRLEGGCCERTSISLAELSKLAFDKRVEGAEQRDEWGRGRGGGEVRVGRRSPLLQLTGEWVFFFFFQWEQPGNCWLLEKYLRVQLAEMIRLHSGGADEDRWVLLITNNCRNRLSVTQSKKGATETSHMSLINPLAFHCQPGTCNVAKLTGKQITSSERSIPPPWLRSTDEVKTC